MAMSAEQRSELHTFTGSRDVSVWVNNSRVGRKNPKQTKKQTNKTREKITNINELTFSDTPGSKDGDKGT